MAKFPNNLQAKSFNSSQIQHGAPGTFQFTEYPKDRLLLDSNYETYDKDTFCTNYKIIYQDNENGITECLCLGHDFEENDIDIFNLGVPPPPPSSNDLEIEVPDINNGEEKTESVAVLESKCESKCETEDESLYEHVKDDSLLGSQFMRQSRGTALATKNNKNQIFQYEKKFGILDSFDNGTYKIKQHKHKNTGDTKYIVKKYGNSIRFEVSKDQMGQQEDDVLDNTLTTSNKSMKRKTQMADGLKHYLEKNRNQFVVTYDDHNIATSEFDSEDDGSDDNSSKEIIEQSAFAIGSKWIIHGLVSKEGQKLNGHICTVENCVENRSMIEDNDLCGNRDP